MKPMKIFISCLIGFILSFGGLLATAQAQISNGDFETGDFSGWTVSGTAWGSGPIDNDLGVAPAITGWQGTYYANSRATGSETAVGILRSQNFTLPDQIEFLIGGWSAWGGGSPPTHNYVVLKLANGTELDRVWAPNHNNLTNDTLASPAHVGQEVYLEVIDDGTDGGFAWLEVDHFRLIDYPAIEDILSFASGSLIGWTQSGDSGMWGVEWDPDLFTSANDPERYVCSSRANGETPVGTITSPNFTITSPFQTFSLSGWDGTGGTQNGGTSNYVRMRRASDDAILREAHTPGQNTLIPYRWQTFDLIGEEVYLEVVDGNALTGFAWLAFADYEQQEVEDLTTVDDLYGVNIHASATQEVCRTVPFLTAPTFAPASSVGIGASADVVYCLGMINNGWDHGVAHWGAHPEMNPSRPDQISIGEVIGTMTIHYQGGASDAIALTMGVTAWHVESWSNTPTETKEPFVSRPDLAAVLANNLFLYEDELQDSLDTRNRHFYLAITPRSGQVIDSITVSDNAAKSGVPGLWGVTLRNPSTTAGFHDYGTRSVSLNDLTPRLDLNQAGALDFLANVEAMKDALYTSDDDIPTSFPAMAFTEGLDAARIRFFDDGSGLPIGDMLSNIWVANINEIDHKFDVDTGFFHESGPEAPWYGHYTGVGCWADGWGLYNGGAFARSSDHFASVALKRINNPTRLTSYVDYCDSYLYFYRDNNDPAEGPPNAALTSYPSDAPPHWSFVLNAPYPTGPDTNSLQGNEETDGHGATCVGRWVAWRRLGAPTDGWLTDARPEVYGHSRWDSTRDAADFICWFMDYMGQDAIYCEGETTGWAGGYEPYPTWVCAVALRCSAQIADALGESADATRWRTYADRLEGSMLASLTTGAPGSEVWKQSYNSVYPSFQDRLVHAWFSIYYDGYDSKRWEPAMTAVTVRTLATQLDLPTGHAPVLAMGYGQGWLTKSALLLDEMDDAGPLLSYLAKCTYDKNQNYVDEANGIDWRPWMFVIPEGSNLMPDGRWHRINDLSNGANQGPALHALEVCAGVDDTNPNELKIMPRVPAPLNGIEVENYFTLIASGGGLDTARIYYHYKYDAVFTLTSDKPLPTLSLRVGPYAQERAEFLVERLDFPVGSTQRIERSGHADGQDAWWIWIEGMTEVDEVFIKLKYIAAAESWEAY